MYRQPYVLQDDGSLWNYARRTSVGHGPKHITGKNENIAHRNWLLKYSTNNDVINMKFLKLWDLSGYSEKNNVQEAYLPKMSISG